LSPGSVTGAGGTDCTPPQPSALGRLGPSNQVGDKRAMCVDSTRFPATGTLLADVTPQCLPVILGCITKYVAHYDHTDNAIWCHPRAPPCPARRQRRPAVRHRIVTVPVQPANRPNVANLLRGTFLPGRSCHAVAVDRRQRPPHTRAVNGNCGRDHGYIALHRPKIPTAAPKAAHPDPTPNDRARARLGG